MSTRTGRGNKSLYVLVALTVQTLIAGLTNLDKLRVPAPGSPTRVDDTDLYYRYASNVRQGKVPYRDFVVEYPPLALPFFLAPRVVSQGLAGYKRAFAVEMLLLNALTVWVVASFVERKGGLARVPARLAWYTLYFGLLSRYMVSRFDAAPMCFGFAAAVGWSSGRNRLGGVLAALGTLVKFYPALVAVLGSLREIRRPGASGRRGTIVFALTMMLGVSGWLAIDGVGGVSRSLAYHVERGLEYGSLYAGVQMLAAKVMGATIVVGRDHASYSSVTPWTPRLLPLVFPCQVLSILLVLGIYLRRGMRDELRYGAATILAFIVTGKVFSPQFLIWLMPFFAVLDGPVARRARWIFAAGCVATLLAPSGTSYFPRTSLWIILPYNLKNVVFLGLWIALVLGPAESDSRDGTNSDEHPSPRRPNLLR